MVDGADRGRDRSAAAEAGEARALQESGDDVITEDQLTEWADSILHINHLNTLVEREIAAGRLERAAELSGRAQRRAWKMLNEMFAAGARKPDGYCEPDPAPGNSN